MLVIHSNFDYQNISTTAYDICPKRHNKRTRSQEN